MPDSSPLRLFIIYAREDQPALLELKAHLRPLEKRGGLTVWYDGEILPGEDWDKAIKARLAAADIVLLLISSSFFTSDYIEKEELKKALERHRKGEAMVVPVIVRHCVWNEHPEISALQALPSNAKPISSWSDTDEAFTDVVRGMQRLVLTAKKSSHEAEEARVAAEKVGEAIQAYDAGRVEEAFELLSQYASTPYPVNPRGHHILGKIYHYAEGGVVQDFKTAMHWYLKGAEGGYLNSFVNISVMYANGQSVSQDYTEAVKWAQKAAEMGDVASQAHLGLCYANGYGVPQDYTEAARWTRKAAEQGDAMAQANLGVSYENGLGVIQNYADAAKWYRKAAEQGNANAQVNLGVIYANARGVAQDYIEAVKWYRKAAEQGDALGQANLGGCFIIGQGIAQDFLEGAKWVQKAAEQGDAKGQFLLGACYEGGYGVSKDILKAAEWYRKSAAHGNEESKERLKYLGYSE
jgi:TPR repeat protein